MNKKSTYIGIDLGTSSVKLLLVAAGGEILNSAVCEYPVYYPKSGWSEQNPQDWYAGTVNGIKKLLSGFDKCAVKGISFGGQMHGLVLLDSCDKVIRPAILWNDGRTQSQTDYLNEKIGKNALLDMTANIAFAGFTAPKILWVRENEPENFARTAKIMLPKDFLAYKFCGKFSTDFSDASGTLLLDVKNRAWSKEMCAICDIRTEQLPALYESFEITGIIKKEIAEELGLDSAVKIIAGAGDNAAAAIGTGTVGEGGCNISLGTSGTVFVSSEEFNESGNAALHSFCHADGGYHLMGCILSAASCNRWWVKDILQSGYEAEQNGVEEFIGKNDVFFLPYLMGERCPHNDISARGAFIGMRPDTTREQLTLAVFEGVMFALKDCFEAATRCGAAAARTKICGGGAKNPVWVRLAANILGIPVDIPAAEEGPAYGAAMLAMTGCGEYKTVAEAAKACVKIKDAIYPDEKLVKAYGKKYEVFKEFYPALKDIFRKM